MEQTSFGTSSSLGEREEKGEVAVNSLLLELAGSLNTLPGRGNLDQDTVLANTYFLLA